MIYELCLFHDLVKKMLRCLLGPLFIFSSLFCFGCGGPTKNIQTEVSYWGQFNKVIEGPLPSGISALPTPIKNHHCYRLFLATEAKTAPLVRYQGEIDADSVGFPIMPLEMRSDTTKGGALAVYGFCSKGSGKVTLMTKMDGPGQGAFYEAAGRLLDPKTNPDVEAVYQWLAEKQKALGKQQAEEAERLRLAAMQQYLETVTEEMRSELSRIVGLRGRYANNILDEVRAGEGAEESLVLDPGKCYLFAVLPHLHTLTNVDLRFSVIRNAAEREDVDGGIFYSVCTASQGPLQEVTFVIEATVPENSPHPPIYAFRVAHRDQRRTESREANAEWRRNDPELRK